MEADTMLNLIALVAPVFVVYFGTVAYLRTEDALDHRARLAELRRQPFHPTQLSPEQRLEIGVGGQTPGIWHLERSVDYALGRSTTPPTRLDYMREFHPEKLKYRQPSKASPRRWRWPKRHARQGRDANGRRSHTPAQDCPRRCSAPR